jgi:hypothetical protein
MINTNELLSRLLGQTSPNENIAKTIAAQTFPSGSFGRAQLAAPVGAPAPPPQAPSPAVPDLPAVQEVADKPLIGTEYAPPQPAPAPAPAAAPGARRPAPDFSPSFAQKMMNFGDNLNGKGSDLGEQSKSRSQTFAMLRDKWGLDEQTAEFAARNPAVLQSLFTSKFGGGQTDDMREYAMDMKQLADRGETKLPSLGEWMRQTKRTNAVQWKDLGTELVGFDSTGNEVSRVPKDVAGKAAAQKAGEAQGESQAKLTDAITNSDYALATVDKIKNHPGRAWGTGGSSALWSPPGTSKKDFDVLLDQAKGQTFLQAFNSLRGGGAITEEEGKKATAALARLDQAQTEESFLAAIDELEVMLRKGQENARRKAQGLTPLSAPPGTAPDALPGPSAPGTVRKYNPATGALE